MECIKKIFFCKKGLNIIVDEIYNEIRNELLLIVFSKIGIYHIGLVVVALV